MLKTNSTIVRAYWKKKSEEEWKVIEPRKHDSKVVK